MNELSQAQNVVAVAAGEVGYLEKTSNSDLDHKTANAGSNNWTKYARDMDALGAYNGKKNGYAWCCVFVDWCLTKAFGFDLAFQMIGKQVRGAGASCTSTVGYYKSIDRWFSASPQLGDQIFFTRDGKTSNHTGIVVEVKNGKVYTIEGNTSGASGVVANGGGVCAKSYKLNYKNILGYGRPNWDLALHDNVAQTDNDRTGDNEDMMNVEQFKTLWCEMRKELQDNDAGAWGAEARAWAVNTGLIAGNGTTINGEPNYMWEDVLTREQLITMLYRFAKMIGKA